MGLTLIKSGIFPNPDADQGQHEFTYALFPHQGDFRKGGVVREAYDLNCPMAWEKVQGIYEDSFSMLQIAEENVMADTVKAERMAMASSYVSMRPGECVPKCM